MAALRSENPDDIVVGDLVLLECLQGARDERHAAQIESTLTAFMLEPMLNPQLAIDQRETIAPLRALGLAPRKKIDTIVATFCIRHGYCPLHQDRHFRSDGGAF